MAKSKASENIIRLQCSSCKRITYYSRKNKKTTDRKIELSKYCRFCRKHTTHKEAKKR